MVAFLSDRNTPLICSDKHAYLEVFDCELNLARIAKSERADEIASSVIILDVHLELASVSELAR